MLRFLGSIAGVLALSCTLWAQTDSAPAVIVLLDADIEIRADAEYGGRAILLDPDANEAGSIDDLGLSASISKQNKVQIDPDRERIFVVESRREQVSVFDYAGDAQAHFPLPHVGSIILSDRGNLLGCMVGISTREQETIFIDPSTGEEVRRLPFGGVAITADEFSTEIWSAGTEVIGFDIEGNIFFRRPLPRLDAEPHVPTVINNRSWCATSVVMVPHENDWSRRIWCAERKHPEASGSQNRLFAVDPRGQVRILVELDDVLPISLASATVPGRTVTHVLVIVDAVTGDLLQFNVDGELMRRQEFDARAVTFGKSSGLWVATRTSVIKIDPRSLAVLAEYTHDFEGEVVGFVAK